MRTDRRVVWLGLAGLGAAACLGAGDGLAQQAYPSRAVTIIVPAAAGGPSDTVARIVAEAMARPLGVSIVIENIGGAGGTVGTARAAKAAPDGYTLLLYHITQATSVTLYSNLSYDPVGGFESIGRITDVPMTVVGRANLPPKDVPELITWIKEKKTAATMAHAGVGSAAHLCGLLLQSALASPMTAVAYRGTGPALNDLVGGQFDLMCDQTTNTTNQIKEGKIKGYAVTTQKRVASLPVLPTLDESGLKGFEMSAWHGLWAPKGTPREAIDKLAGALQSALKDPKVIERFAVLGTEPVPQDQATPAALKAKLDAEVAKWGPIIKAAGVSLKAE